MNDFIFGIILVILLDVLYLIANEPVGIINTTKFVINLPYTLMGFAISFFFALKSTLKLSEVSVPLVLGLAFSLAIAFSCKKLNQYLDSSSEQNIWYYVRLIIGMFVPTAITIYTLVYLYDLVKVAEK
ncbi:MAG: hypothetical protein ACRDAG_03930 [Cetobacterium somerae]|uniref:hypothetical protein n=1 Tax=Cetobacterium somerae TaxID=188913 RepID=UPI003F3AA03C